MSSSPIKKVANVNIIRKGILEKSKKTRVQRQTTASAAKVVEVTRDEFQELEVLVTKLKNESLRHLQLETEAQTEFEYIKSQVKSTQTALAALSESLQSEMATTKADVMFKQQEYQVKCNERLECLENGMERLEFRFAHHIRDCQLTAEEIDRHAETLTSLKGQVCHSDVEMRTSFEEMRNLCTSIKFMSLRNEEKTIESLTACAHKVESLEHRLMAYAKNLETEIHDYMAETRHKIQQSDAASNRHVSNVHKTMNEVMEMRQTLRGLDDLEKRFQRQQEKYLEGEQKKNEEVFESEQRLKALESGMHSLKQNTSSLVQMVQVKTKARIEGLAQVLETLANIVQETREDVYAIKPLVLRQMPKDIQRSSVTQSAIEDV